MAKYRKMLNDWDAPYIQNIVKLIETQSKITLISWAISYSQNILLPVWNKYFPNDGRPLAAINVGKAWMNGEIKLPEAKKKILEAHEAARETEENPVAQGIARAIAQSASTIHVARHCIGLVLYGALALSYETTGVTANWSELEKNAEMECNKMYDALKLIAVENEPNPAKIVWYC